MKDVIDKPLFGNGENHIYIFKTVPEYNYDARFKDLHYIILILQFLTNLE